MNVSFSCCNEFNSYPKIPSEAGNFWNNPHTVATTKQTKVSKTAEVIKINSVVTVSKCFLSVGFGRFCRKNLGFRFDLGFHDKRIVNFFMTRVIWHDFHHH